MFRNATRLYPGSFYRIFPRFAIEPAANSPSSPLIDGSLHHRAVVSLPRSRGIASNPSSVEIGIAGGSEIARVGGPLSALHHYGRCYWELSKARLSMLVVATSGAGYVLGSGTTIDFAGLCWTCAGTMMVSASANSLNQVFEVSNDAKMKRTMRRPLPSGRLSVSHAIMWASSVGLAGTTLLAWKANAFAAELAASNLVLYAFVYTPLKQLHPANTWGWSNCWSHPPIHWVGSSIRGYYTWGDDSSCCIVLLADATFYGSCLVVSK